MSDKKHLFLLDAYALIFRAYYAFIRNPRVTSKGFNSSAIFGFVNSLEEVLRSQQPSHIAVVFDAPGKTMRAEEFEYYKANRQETPEDIKASVPWIKDIVKAYKIPLLEATGYEADDVIGTLAKKAAREGFTVYMMTPDKDFAQLVEENIYMYKPGRQGKPAEVLGVDEVKEKFQIERPEQVIDILGLMGDSVDNIPGVPGVGEKTAMKLIQQFGSVEAMYEHTDELKGKLKEKIEENRQQAFDSKKLATILLDAPVAFEPDKLILETPDKQTLSNLFNALEFRTLGQRVLGDDFAGSDGSGQGNLFAAPSSGIDVIAPTTKNIENTEHDYQLISTAAERETLIKTLLKKQVVAFDTETHNLDTHTTDLLGISFSYAAGQAYFVDCPDDRPATEAIVAEFAQVFQDPGITKVGHNIKFDMEVLHNHGLALKGPIYDTMVAQFVSNPDVGVKLDHMAESLLGYKMVPIEELIGKRGRNQKSMKDVPLDQLSKYAAEDADLTFQLKAVTDESAKQVNATRLLEEVEFPLIYVLTDMECNGVRLDEEFLKNLSDELTQDIIRTRDTIYTEAKQEFNLDSPKQLGDILFEQMGIEYSGKKTKTGQYSTAEDVLSKIRTEHEIIPAILEYRELSKLKSTYVDALPSLISKRTGRVHTTFAQTIAATGRLSSNNPNLQNIPIRTKRGREIRKAFIPKDDDHQILSADYSQVELRIIAHITGDNGMAEAFAKGEDIHASTAAKVFGVALADVTSEMRRKAKAVNFGLAYGQSAFGLSQTLAIPRSEAKEIIDNYFEQFPGIKDYMAETKEFARENGYIETILGRRRYLRDINSRNWTVRAQAERNAINSPIQGSAADLIKVAMINIHKQFRSQNLKSQMILQVHDELVFEAHRDELEMIQPMIEEGMKNAIPGLSVPIVVDMGVGANWLEAH